MRLNDKEIQALLDTRPHTIQPMPPKEAISGVTVDVTLANSFTVMESHSVDVIDLSAEKEDLEEVFKKLSSLPKTLKEGERLYIHPGELVLGCLEEVIDIPDDMVGWLDGRSSLARLGLFTHVTANRIDPGFQGQVVLEFYNGGKIPLALKPGMKIGAVSFEKLSGTCDKPYRLRSDAKYKDQRGAVSSRLTKD